MHGRLVLLSTVAAIAVVAGSAAAAGAATGLHGTVTRSPIRPVCIEGRPCSEPAAGVVLVFRRSGHTVARATTTSAGSYRVVLRRGTYSVSVAGLRPVGGLTPRTVRVVPGRMTRVDLDVDTGLR